MDIILGASLREFHNNIVARRARVAQGLKSLRKQESEFASEHRILLAMYEEILTIVDRVTATRTPQEPSP